MKHNNIVLKLFFILALIITLSGQVYASEVTGSLSSSTTQGAQGGASSGSQVSGTLGNGTISSSGAIAGTVSGGSTSGGGGGSSGGGGGSGGGSSTGSVQGASTTANPNNPGEVLGETDTPGFPDTGLPFGGGLSTARLIGLAIFFAALTIYVYRRTKIHV